MAFTQVSYDNIQDPSDYTNIQDESLDYSGQDDQKELPNLNPEFNLDHQEFDKVVYYKNPKVHSFVVIACGLPLIWLLFSAFSPAKNTAEESAPVDAEKAEMSKQIEELVQMNKNLTKEVAMADQAGAIEVTDYTPEPVVAEAEAEPVVAEPVVAEAPEPEIDPMDQWLNASSSGHYLTSAVGNSDDESVENQEITQKAELPGLFKDKELAARLKTEIPSGKSGNLNRRIALGEEAEESLKRRQQEISEAQKIPQETLETLETGSSASATLERSISWGATSNNSANISQANYSLTLNEEWKNTSGEEVFPEGTKVIAKINTADRSGILNMEVVRIQGEEGNIKVPKNTILIDGKKGSTLRAELKREGNSSLTSDLGSIAASGVEESFEELGAASSNFILGDDGGDTFITTQSNSDGQPLASGVSGLADGVGNVLEARLQAQQSSPSSSYFELKQGTTVELTVNEDFEYENR